MSSRANRKMAGGRQGGVPWHEERVLERQPLRDIGSRLARIERRNPRSVRMAAPRKATTRVDYVAVIHGAPAKNGGVFALSQRLRQFPQYEIVVGVLQRAADLFALVERFFDGILQRHKPVFQIVP